MLPYFNEETILGENCEAQDSHIAVGDIRHSIMKKMIQYMYTDEIPKVSSKQILEIMAASDKFFLEGLKSCMMQKLCSLGMFFF